jgi:hypothetical protein
MSSQVSGREREAKLEVAAAAKAKRNTSQQVTLSGSLTSDVGEVE